LIQKWSIGDFEILQQLGNGKFGQVYAARELQTDFVVALKKMSRIELTQNNF
jgi:aurora kinase